MKEDELLEVFKLTLGQMLELFLFMLVGFFLRRKKLLKDEAGVILAKLETLVFVPAMIVDSFLQICPCANLADNGLLLLYSIGSTIIVAILSGPASALFSKEPHERGCYRYSLAVPNSGYVGNAVVLGVLGSTVLFRYIMYTVPITVFTYVIAIQWLTGDSEKFSWRKLVSPFTVSTAIGIVLGLSGLKLPKFVTTSISAAGACMAPVAMVMIGFIIGGYDLRKLLQDKKVYAVSVCRLIVIPLIFFGLLKLFRVPQDILVIMIAYVCMPLGMNTILFPAAAGRDTTAGASMMLISNVMAIVTIPLMFMLIM